jgi:DNA-binding response OmpR family regulator
VKVVLHDLGSDELCEKLRDGFLHLAVMIRPSGTELGTQIGADWALHHVPIVFVTALITPEEASDGRRVDGHRISAKPHTAAELLRAVEENRPCCAEANQMKKTKVVCGQPGLTGFYLMVRSHHIGMNNSTERCSKHD